MVATCTCVHAFGNAKVIYEGGPYLISEEFHCRYGSEYRPETTNSLLYNGLFLHFQTHTIEQLSGSNTVKRDLGQFT